MKKRIHVAICLFYLLLSAAIFDSVLAQKLSEPEENFEYLWQTFDRNYGIFGPKKVDWEALYKIYRPQVTPQTTDSQLFDIMANLLGHLNDNHVRLRSPERSFQSGILGSMKMEDFSLDLIKNTYLKGHYQQRMNDVYHFGWLSDSIGYFHFGGFGRVGQSTDIIDEIIHEFKDAKGIIVDVRSNGGGDDRVGKLIADRFADQKRLYMTTYTRDGNAHNDFTAAKYWYVEPAGAAHFTKPVILLTHRFSVSAAENFALAMRVLPHVTVVGDATSGVFADVYSDRLPNGWQFRCSYKLFVDQTGFCWEGIGVPADIRQTNTKQDIENSHDRVIDLAIALLNTNALKLQKESDSLQNIRESLVDILAREIDHKSIESAINTFRNLPSSNPNAYYIDEDHLNALGQRLLVSGKVQEAVEVFKISTEEFPNAISGYENLADAYFDSGDTKQGNENYTKSMEINRRSYPWEKESYKAAERVIAGAKILHKVLDRTTDEQGIRKRVESYHRSPIAYYVAEVEMNRLGYKFLGEEKVLEAIEVFKINVKEFPESSNVYDSLGEAYMVNGDAELSIENYQKSVELNPNNRNGINALKRLKEKSSSKANK